MRKLLVFACAILTLAAVFYFTKDHASEKKDEPMNPRETQNHLASEKSPYLLQHAGNPVDWYPWGKEAFEKAQSEEKPIFLSIGYSTCHWCHVMEEESFENQEIADFLNEHFISIKVDREERPDIDKIYMSFVMASTGSGGWPMSVFLTPDRKPFFGGTYFPPDDRYGRPGFMTVLEKISESWKLQRGQIEASGDNFVQLFNESISASKPSDISEEVMRSVFRGFLSSYDAVRGGFGAAPKFPTPHNLSFLMRYYSREGEVEALNMAVQTLKKMAYGGIRDHVGGGFHRYSVDAEWFVPHFEKMLYDQALLLRAYAEAYQITEDDLFRDVASEIAEYVLEDMSDQNGGYYSAEDADSYENASKTSKTEGAYYLWDADELKAILKDDFSVFEMLYGIQAGGNVFEDPHGEFSGKNHLSLTMTPEEVAEKTDLKVEEVRNIQHRSLEKLNEARSARVRPHLDDKILTDWNGLMIDAMAYAGEVFGKPQWVEHASKTASRILDEFKDSKGRLMHRYRDGDLSVQAQLDDYAFLIKGLLALYHSEYDPKWIVEADRLAQIMIENFFDTEESGFFMTADQDGFLIARPKDFQDGALPSGNSVASYVLLQLSSMLQNENYGEVARKSVTAANGYAASGSASFSFLMHAVDFAVGPTREIVLSADSLEKTLPFRREIAGRFLPRTVVIFRQEGETEFVKKYFPYASVQKPISEGATAYVCRNHVCQLPTDQIETFTNLINHN